MRTDGSASTTDVQPPSGRPVDVFTFQGKYVDIDDAGRTRELHGMTPDSRPAPGPNMQAFHVIDTANYGKAMTDCLAWLLAHGFDGRTN